ncbi:hypothetical protein HUU05_00830 [candidate division KSB1 bacterium]|nr:hypothetical protein [candidate division KSB1 bacterium]
MFLALWVNPDSATNASTPENDASLARRRASAKWIAALGWLISLGGLVCIMIGLADVQNMIILAAVGIVFVPLGLLVVANGHILAGLAAIERNTRGKEFPHEKGKSTE